MKSRAKPLPIFLFQLILLIQPIKAAAQRDIQSPQATDHFVSPNGTDDGGCTNPANPCKTILYTQQQTASRRYAANPDRNAEQRWEILVSLSPGHLAHSDRKV